RAGVSYTVGREPNSRYNESLNGIRGEMPKHQFIQPVDPYVKHNEPGTGLLSFVEKESEGSPGDGDLSVQAYNFRLCYTQIPANRLPHTPPEKYDPGKY